jgi:hypothetical protein
VRHVPTWATEKRTPNFGETSGLAHGSGKQFEIMHLISVTRH